VSASEVRNVTFSLSRSRWAVIEAGVAAAAFVVLCVLVLRASPYLPEPDDAAYRASIVAMTHGHFFTLSGAQAQALAEQVAPRPGLVGPGGGPIQWVQLASGRWISEKDPGYPYLAVVFQTLGIIRGAPLFFGAAGSAARPPSVCTAPPARQWSSPGVTTCRPSPTRR